MHSDISHRYRGHSFDRTRVEEQRSADEIQILQSSGLRHVTRAYVYTESFFYELQNVVTYFPFVRLFYSTVVVDSADRISGVFRRRT